MHIYKIDLHLTLRLANSLIKSCLASYTLLPPWKETASSSFYLRWLVPQLEQAILCSAQHHPQLFRSRGRQDPQGHHRSDEGKGGAVSGRMPARHSGVAQVSRQWPVFWGRGGEQDVLHVRLRSSSRRVSL